VPEKFASGGHDGSVHAIEIRLPEYQKWGFPPIKIPTNFAYNLLYQASPVCSRDCNFVMATHSRKAVVVGGGPVGCLSAMALARMGWDVEIYEARPGLRHHTLILNIF
jgi:NADPH-dependent 2,4-dienoyl-CoA reductase/sulfur reductase-like enzyme